MKIYVRGMVGLIALCLQASLGFGFVSEQNEEATKCDHALIFFDLGETLVDTKTNEDPVTHDYKKIYYFKKTTEYLKSLQKKGHKLGMIINVPETWGVDNAAKFAKLKDFVKASWNDPKNPEFRWNDFEPSMILLPPDDAHRKGKSPYLFELAKKFGDKSDCPVVFQGEEENEVDTAADVGMEAFLVKRDGANEPIYMSIEKLDAIVNR